MEAPASEGGGGAPGRLPHPRRLGRFRGTDGAVLTETAVVLSVLLVPLVLGIIEYGMLFKDKLTMETGARAGARAGASAANSANADDLIVQTILSATSALPPGSLRRIVVYASDRPDGAVPLACKQASSAAQKCNSYGTSDFALATVNSSAWPPSARNNNLADSIDYLGVWVNVNHSWVTGAFGSARWMSDQVVMRLEPTPLLKPPPP